MTSCDCVGYLPCFYELKKAQPGGIKRYSFNRIYTPPTNKMADLMSRPMSLSFNTRFLNRLKHEEVVSAINERVNTNIECIKAIPITEKKCIITVSDESTKQDLVLSGLSLQGRHVSIHDVDKNLYNCDN